MIVCTKSVILIYEGIEPANAWSVRVRCPGICSRSGRQRGPTRGILGVRELLDYHTLANALMSLLLLFCFVPIAAPLVPRMVLKILFSYAGGVPLGDVLSSSLHN